MIDEDTSRGQYEDLSEGLNRATETVAVATASHDEDEDDALSYFQKLAEE